MMDKTTIAPMRVIDSHTGGEPTRVVVAGAPDLGGGSLAEKCRVFATRFDHVRRAVVMEPRGSDVLVGAMLVETEEPDCAAGMIFFNNVGVLGMCGHGAIGVVATLAHLGRIGPGIHRLDTPVGVVSACLHEDGAVSITNVPAYRKAKGVRLDVPGHAPLSGDVAWGGNWFVLVDGHGKELVLENHAGLTEFTLAIRRAVHAAGYPEVDHVELFGPAVSPANHSRNFVLCPGGAYDRSPCGTGTSAKLACLVADGKLAPGEIWRQESIVGSVFEGTVALHGGEIHPTIKGRAWVVAESSLLFDPGDPFCLGFPTSTRT